ncbi:TPA: hypothetical protein DCQ18_02710 [Candidatus Campbellbacteria bacterium]|nr:hypothetical protein [Candidatus Campbellbacteria bacterium]
MGRTDCDQSGPLKLWVGQRFAKTTWIASLKLAKTGGGRLRERSDAIHNHCLNFKIWSHVFLYVILISIYDDKTF